MSTKNQTTLLKTCYFDCLCWENLPQTLNFCYKLEHVQWNIDLCWMKVVILDNYCYFYFQCAINLMMGPLIPACSVRMKNGAKSSRPCSGKTPAEVREGFVKGRPAWFVSQFLLIIWDMFAPSPSPQGDTTTGIREISAREVWKMPFSPTDLGITWITSGVWRLPLWNYCCRDRHWEFGEPALNSRWEFKELFKRAGNRSDSDC